MGIVRLFITGACLLSLINISIWCQAATVLQAVDIVADTLPSFSTEVTDPKFVVALDVSRAASQDEQPAAGKLLGMKDKRGRKFNCQIPDISSTDDQATGNAGSLAVAAGGKSQKSPSELLSVLDSLCMYRIEDWWTYELCYKKHVRQFHKDEKAPHQVVADFSLGSYNEEESNMDVVHDDGSAGGISSKYVSQMYTGGEPCDITGKPRQTEVRFMCSEGAKDAITSLREVATCQYRLTFSSGRICGHPAFRAPEAPVHHVMCMLDADSATDSSRVAGVPGDAAEGGQTPAGEEDPQLASGGRAGDPGAVVEEGAPSGSLEDLRQVIKDVGEDLGVNTTSLETALLNAHDGEPDQVPGDVEAAAAAQSRDKVETAADVAKEPKAKAAGGSRDAVVGPPAPQNRDPDEELFYYDDGVEEDEEDEELDEHSFTRSGMHAEL
ncbi:probable protein OS-9 at N-terminal half [Coccomyxa sp. Obi]|nr:probable protein OS-9 at N-terminal half [Coccomyxa sp. Obi]